MASSLELSFEVRQSYSSRAAVAVCVAAAALVVAVASVPPSSSLSQHPADIEQSVCQSDYFRARCSGADEVLIVTRALYGRMRMSKCVKENFGYVGCSNDVIDIVDSQCSGRRECSIRILDENFLHAKPCHDDLKSYLQVNYHCVKVISADKQDCQAHRPLVVTNRTGYLASLTSAETGCGTSESPWYIEALPGQRINITLFDFTPPDSTVQGPGRPQVNAPAGSVPGLGPLSEPLGGGPSGINRMCRVYATIREATSKRSATVCGGGMSRQKSVHISVDHQVEIRIINSHSSPKPLVFVLKYEAVGCPELREPLGGWAKHETDEAIFGCFGDSGDTWRLVCHGSTWIGDHRNCSPAITEASTDDMLSAVSFPLGLSIAIIVTLAVAIWLAILAVGIVCLKSLRAAASNRQQRPLAAHNIDMSGGEDLYGRDGVDYRSAALSLGELRHLQTPYVGCMTCNTSGASCDNGKQQTVVCTLRNTRTATLVHRLQQQHNNGTAVKLNSPSTRSHGNGHRGSGGGGGGGIGLGVYQQRPSESGSDDVHGKDAATRSEIYCRSPYCTYTKTSPGTAVYNMASCSTTTTASDSDGNAGAEMGSSSLYVVSQRQSTSDAEDDDGGSWNRGASTTAQQLNLGKFSTFVQPSSPRCINSLLLATGKATSGKGLCPPPFLMENDLTRSCPLSEFHRDPSMTDIAEVHQQAATGCFPSENCQ